jgi:hypothetical protein
MNPSSNPSPYRHTSGKSIRVKTASPDSAVTSTTAQDPTKTTAWYLARRLRLALHDLGVLHVPPEWMQATPEGISFRSLSVREADKLTLAVEDLALGRRTAPATPGPNQLPLF